MVRKHVIGPPAEHNGRRIEHLAPHIASFVAPTPISWASLYTAHPGVLDSEDDYPPGFYDSDSENELEMYYDY